MSDYPAWLQAAAAIVALGIATWGNLRPDRAAKRRERLQARCIATAIYPEFLPLQVERDRANEFVDSGYRELAPLVGQSIAHTVTMNAVITVPPMLDRNVDRLYQLGEPAGPTVLQLVSVTLQYNSLVEDLSQQIGLRGPGDWAQLLGALRGRLHTLQMLIGQAQIEVAELHDAPPRRDTLPSEVGPVA